MRQKRKKKKLHRYHYIGDQRDYCPKLRGLGEKSNLRSKLQKLHRMFDLLWIKFKMEFVKKFELIFRNMVKIY